MSLGDMISERKNGMISELIDFQSITFKNYVGNEYVFTVVFIDFTIEVTIDISLNVVTNYILVDGTLPIDSNDLLYYLNTIIGIETLAKALDTKVVDFMTIMQNINNDVAKYSEIRDNLDGINSVLLNINEVVALGYELLSTDNIENISSDLLLGVNSEIRKANLLKENIDTVVSIESKLDSTIALEPKLDAAILLESKMDYSKDIIEPKIDSIVLLEDKIDETIALEPKLDYIKYTVEPKLDYADITLEPKLDSIILLEPKIDNVIALENKLDTVIANKLDIQNAEENALLSKNYANDDEDTEVEPGLYSAKHWATKAQDLVTNGILSDDEVYTYKTYSSYKIEAELLERDNVNASQQSDINGLISSILALNTANAQGQFGGNTTIALSTTEQVLPFSVITQSTDATAFEIGTNIGTIKEAGTYSFISTVVFEDTGANGAVGTVTFNLRDTTTNSIYYTQSTTIEISGFDRETIPFNSLMVVPDTITLPITIDINVSCNITGYSIVGFNSILSQSGGSVQTIETIDSALGSLITGVLI